MKRSTTWEVITVGDHGVTSRLPVEGGWLYAVTVNDGAAVSVTFVPDFSAQLKASMEAAMESATELPERLEEGRERAASRRRRRLGDPS